MNVKVPVNVPISHRSRSIPRRAARPAAGPVAAATPATALAGLAMPVPWTAAAEALWTAAQALWRTTATRTDDTAAGASAGEAAIDRVLVDEARGGDRDAFAGLVRRHQRRIFRLAARFFPRPEDVDDVAQEIFLRVWQRLDEFRGEAPFEHWLTRVALNTCRDLLRRAQARGAGRTRAWEEGDGAATGEGPAAASDSTRRLDARIEVERLLDRLTPADRFLVLLLYGEGLTVAEAARRLGWTVANVKVRAFRARRRLRRLLEATDGAGGAR